MSGTWEIDLGLEFGWIYIWLSLILESRSGMPDPHPTLPARPAPKFSLYPLSKYIALSCGEPI